MLLSVAVGTLLVSRPLLALLPLAALATVLLLVDGRARAAFLLFGGMFLLQTPTGLDTNKLAFLAGALVAFIGAFLRVQGLRHTPAYRLAEPLLTASLALAALAALSVPVAYLNGIPQKDWLRDIDPYLLLAAAPVFALDAQAAFSRKALVKLLVAVGTLGALSFAVLWLQRRGIAHLPVDRLAVATLFVPAALFAYAMSAGLQGAVARIRWFLLAAFVFAMLISTSTRSTLALIAAPFAIAFGVRRNLTARSIRLALIGPLAVGLTLAIAQTVIMVSGSDEDALSRRIEIIKSTGSETGDASYSDRQTQTRVAWETFEENELVGAGAGASFEWKPQGLPLTSSATLDTPLTFPAKFGLVGLAVLLLIAGAYWVFIRNLGRGVSTVAHLALIGYLAVAVLLAILGNPFEDKGLSFGLILVLALALKEAQPNAGAAGPIGRSIGGKRR
jgi:hypothetical protein